jgi:hypothetical protein
MAILTNLTVNGDAEKDHVNEAVAKRLKELAIGLKEFASGGKDGATETQ